MSASEAALQLSSIEELVEIVDLKGIEVYDLHATAVDRADQPDFREQYAIKVSVNTEPELMRTRFTMTFSARSATYVIDLATRYEFDSPAEVPQPISAEFAERVGIMAAFPFIREHLHGLATRLGHPVPLLGLVKQGQFRLTPDDPQPSGSE